MSRMQHAGALVLAALVAGATPAAATDPEAVSLAAVRISGVVRPGVPIVHLDPSSLWLMGPASLAAPRGSWTGPTVVLLPRLDPTAAWRLNSSTLQRVGARYVGPVEWGDPRLSGRLSVTWSAAPGRSAVAELTTSEGSWSGTLDAIGDPGTTVFRIRGMLWGAGPYAGQASLLDITSVAPGSAWNIGGLLFSTGLLAVR